MQFKVGDKVVRKPGHQDRNGWAHGAEPVTVGDIRFGQLWFHGGKRNDFWLQEYFEPYVEPAAKFDGKPEPDAVKTTQLKGDLAKVFAVLRTAARPLTLYDIAARAGVSQISVGSRVRDLRKAKFGGYLVIRQKDSRDHVYLLAKVVS